MLHQSLDLFAQIINDYDEKHFKAVMRQLVHLNTVKS